MRVFHLSAFYSAQQMHMRKIAAWPAYLPQVLLLRYSNSKMKENGPSLWFEIMLEKGGRKVLQYFSLNTV